MAQGYVTRWPIYSGKFNTRDYPSNAMILNDIETIIHATLKDRLTIDSKSYKVRPEVRYLLYDRA